MSTANELGLGPLFAGGTFTGRAVVFAGDLTGDVIRGATRQGLSSLARYETYWGYRLFCGNRAYDEYKLVQRAEGC